MSHLEYNDEEDLIANLVNDAIVLARPYVNAVHGNPAFGSAATPART
jgi:hypothetical protein